MMICYNDDDDELEYEDNDNRIEETKEVSK